MGPCFFVLDLCLPACIGVYFIYINYKIANIAIQFSMLCITEMIDNRVDSPCNILMRPIFS